MAPSRCSIAVEIPGAPRGPGYPHTVLRRHAPAVMIAMALVVFAQAPHRRRAHHRARRNTQAQIVELLHRLRREEAMAMIFVTHDLGVIADVADEVAAMYAGQNVEQRDRHGTVRRSRHPYTEALLPSMPQITPRGAPLPVIPGVVPRPEQFPASCRFAPRCSSRRGECTAAPVLLGRRPSDAAAGAGNAMVHRRGGALAVAFARTS